MAPPRQPPPIPRAILILGMHRSGTSALAGLLARLGVELSDDLYGADAEANARGFFEHRGAVALNASILDALGSRWDDIGSLPQGWWRREELAPLKDDLRQLIRKDFTGVPTWGLKDPRLCRVLPLWLEVLGELGSAGSRLDHSAQARRSGALAGTPPSHSADDGPCAVAAACGGDRWWPAAACRETS